MNFLLKLVFAGGMAGSVVAAPHEGIRSTPFSADSTHTDNSQSDVVVMSGLNSSYEIKNPYAESADAPFTIASKSPSRTAAPLATKVSCGGRTWEHGQLLGHTQDNQPVNVRIQDNRIYLNWNGRIADNIWILYHLKEGTFQDNPTDGATISNCVNPVDPSTAPSNLLGRTGDGQITCNGIVMTNGDLLGTYVGGGMNTYQYTKYVDGMLRVMIKQGENDDRTTNYNMSLLNFTIQGANGSYMSAKWKNVLTTQMVDGCFWPIVPKSATPIVENNCTAGPTLKTVTNVTQTGLQFTFDGTGISTVKWRIKSNTTDVRTGTTPDLAGAKTVNLTYASLAAGNYSLEIEGGNCTSAVTKLNFTINPPVVTIPDCLNGPAAATTTITNITPSGITVNYASNNLHTFSWRILQGTYAVASGKTGTLATNSTALTFNYLQNGTYNFELTPVDCKAASPTVKSFSVAATDTRTACSRGPSLQSILSSDETTLSFLFDGNNIFAIDWKILQSGTVLRQNRVAPQDNHPVIQFGTLPTGVYTLQVEGGNCKSTASAMNFGVNVPLPIYISNFKGAVVEKGVELSWEVVSEQDGKEFEVLRYDSQMKNEQMLGKVSLTDQRVGQYRFVDKNPLLGTNYYQLKQIDTDGTFQRSKIVSVTPATISGTVVAPNPAQDYVDLQFSSRTSGLSNLSIYDVSGVEVSKSQIQITEGKNNHRLNVKRFSTGNYFIKISHGGETSRLRFTKVN
ncbi:T9SS type A sorting domain-containing protein [Dyadobacter pollutisoli]|uniref:T9SS type A sorting domain-containing protein n=1 Tax=Dyadobacter pollutisoli TaxID=2910158 RepID=A0A9E8NBG2_9BACT|nr:T9SS type A sorting domain-containing protein [Dyadobacter pollutisoli]WAC12238.1 T9SS type A sorting domain-containing protein [Dyadobacter pollutisoli]